MLRISTSQDAQLAGAARGRFVEEMVAHLAPRSPTHARALGPQGLRAVVRFGIDRAAGRGYTLRGPVRLWLELMLVFGGRFDDDPLLPADLHRLLRCEDRDRELPLSQALQAQAAAWLPRLRGPDGLHHRTALARALRLLEDGWAPDGGPLVDRLVELAAWLDGHRFAVLGEPSHRRQIVGALEMAEEFGITDPRDAARFALPALLLGSGFAADPLYPWASHGLADGRVPGAERAARLERGLRDHLRDAVARTAAS